MTIYLYVKTHNKTGLKYLGKTTAKDPHKYPGSGIYWTRHLKQHGYDYTTDILLETTSNDQIREVGLYYSNLWNIVTSKEWANIVPEAGKGSVQTEEIKEKISKTMRGRPAHNKGLKQIHKKHKSRANSIREGQSFVGSNGKLKGRIRPRFDCPHCGKNIDEANFHRYHGDSCKLKSP